MRLVSFDFETHLVQPGLLAPPIVCGTWAERGYGPEMYDGLHLRAEALDCLEALLRDPGVTICGANFAYDLACACTARPSLLPLVFAAYDAGRIFDVLIAQALIDIGEGLILWDRMTSQPLGRYSQSYCEKLYLGVDRAADKGKVKDRNNVTPEELAASRDVWRMRYHELDGVPLDQWPDKAREYPMDDARLCLQVAEAQIKIGTNLHQMAEQARAAWGLHLSAVWGMRTDGPTVAEVSAEIEKGHAEALARFTAVGLFRADGSKDTGKLAALVAQAYGASAPCAKCQGTGKVPSEKTGKPVNCPACAGCGLDISPVPQTETGRVKCDRDTLAESGNELLEAFAEIGENEKWRSTYLPVLQQGVRVPINPETNVLVATGRSSYRKPNLQNLPRNGRIRECFVPRPGFFLASVDYSTLELCTLAQVCLWWTGQSAMAEAINAGRDLHAQFGARVAGVTYEDLKARMKAGDKGAKNFRQMAKAANFGLPGGLGAAKLVAYARQSYGARFCVLSGRAEKCGEEMTTDPRTGKPLCAQCLEVAQELKRLWFEEWPEVAEYHAQVQMLTEGEMGGAVEVPGSEKVGPGLTRGACHFCDGANNGFQGLAARGAKAALYHVAREAYLAEPGEPLAYVRPVVFVHDEILAEVPAETAHEAAHRISEVMVATMQDFVPDVRIVAEPALMRRWLKGAEPVIENGRLVPWEPKH